jgi:2-polyprenyl-6-methoxyphenol hydroxylase-like FAD-dependent oxidoreductase
MRIAVIGAGPTGLFIAVALARRGHTVNVVDRDRGPTGPSQWDRKGVMQFHHPHAFRIQVIEALQAEMPRAWDALLAAGAVPVAMPGEPQRIIAVRCRRMVLERLMRAEALATPGVTLVAGHADEVSHHRGRATGVHIGDQCLVADLVLDATGRAGRLTRGLRQPAEGGDCGIHYVSRQYQLLPGAEEGPTNAPPGLLTTYPGYLAHVFPHDNGTFSTLIAGASTDRHLTGLRFTPAFDAAARAIPPIAIWTDPGRSRPITPPLPGGHLYNNYRGQLDESGRLPLPGLISLGDAVCTTNPTFGRGVTTSLLQACQLVELIEDHGTDLASCALAFDAWCAEKIKPWFADHVSADADLQRRWAGADVDLTSRLPSDLIAAAAEAHPELIPAVLPYVIMQALPSSLDAIEPAVRAIYASGWRPAIPDGPTRDELADLVRRASEPPTGVVRDRRQSVARERRKREHRAAHPRQPARGRRERRDVSLARG